MLLNHQLPAVASGLSGGVRGRESVSADDQRYSLICQRYKKPFLLDTETPLVWTDSIRCYNKGVTKQNAVRELLGLLMRDKNTGRQYFFTYIYLSTLSSQTTLLSLSLSFTHTQMQTRLLDVLLWFLRVFPSSQTLSVITVCVCVFERKRGGYQEDLVGYAGFIVWKTSFVYFYNNHNNLSDLETEQDLKKYYLVS